jgi:hypothetical protein
MTRNGRSELRDVAVAGIFRAVIDRRYPLMEIVEANRYVDTKRKCENVIIDVGETS